MKIDDVGIWGREEYYINPPINKGSLENINVYAFCHSYIKPGHKIQSHKYPYIMVSLVLNGVFTKTKINTAKNPGTISISDLEQVEGTSHVKGEDILERYFILVESSPFIHTVLLHMFQRGLPKFKASNLDRLKYYFEAIRGEMLNDSNIDDSKLIGLFWSLLAEIQKQQTLPETSPVIQKALSFINNHYTEKTFTRLQVTSHIGLNTRSFSSLFHRQTGTTLLKYINSLRIEKVRQKLLFSNETITEIADECGFSYAYYMISKFKKQHGITPQKYREKYRVQNDY